MKVSYSGQQTLSFDGILLTPGIHDMPEAHVEKLKAHPKAQAMAKEGMIEYIEKKMSAEAEAKAEEVSEGKTDESGEGVIAKVFKSKKK